MRLSGVLVFLAVATVASAYPWETVAEDSSEEQLSRQYNDPGWQSSTWAVLQDWFSPARYYFTNRLPAITPNQLATDIRDAAVDMRDAVQEHPVVQSVAAAVQPAGAWIQDRAHDLSRTTFQDIYDNTVDAMRTVDHHVGAWLSQAGRPQQYYDPSSPPSLYYPVPQAENVEQLID